MSKYTTQSEATRTLAAQQTHADMHPGQGVIATPTHNDIAAYAYSLYVKSGSEPGHCEQNWLRAEQCLRTQGQGDCQSKKPNTRAPLPM